MILTLAMIVLFVLLAIGTPVGFAMAGSGVLGLYLVGGMPMLSGILQTAPLSAVTEGAPADAVYFFHGQACLIPSIGLDT